MLIASVCSTSLGESHHQYSPVYHTSDMTYSPHNDVPLATVKESPVLQREGYTQNTFEKTGNPVPTTEGEYTKKGLRLCVELTSIFVF